MTQDQFDEIKSGFAKREAKTKVAMLDAAEALHCMRDCKALIAEVERLRTFNIAVKQAA